MPAGIYELQCTYKFKHTKFYVDPTNILGVTHTFVKTPRSDFTMCKMLLKLRMRFFQNYVFKVGLHDFLETAESIGLKFLHKLYKYIFNRRFFPTDKCFPFRKRFKAKILIRNQNFFF